mmetsp:Transcript_3772/g.5148  ORF Transcript_3772/g.5148 Transcript_3772/m.5148 type:complete len:103 (-) Transcript_3772:470-778(-)
METFSKWKEDKARTLSSHPVWSTLVVSVKPAEFISYPAPSSLYNTDRVLYSAINSAMDDDTKELIDDNICGGLELLESLQTTFSPTLTVGQKQSYINEILNP